MKNNKFILIPDEVLYHKELPASAKLLFGDILRLCDNEKETCWASNAYFAEAFNVSIVSVSLWIKSLKKYGFIKTKVFPNNFREITIKENYNRYLRKLKYITKGDKLLKSLSPKENNNINNKKNTTNTIKLRSKDDDYNVNTIIIKKEGKTSRIDTIDYEDTEKDR